MITAFVIVLCGFFFATPPGSVSEGHSFLSLSDCDLQTYRDMICTVTHDYLLMFVMVVKHIANVVKSVITKAISSTRERIRRVLWEWLQPPFPPARPPQRFWF